MKFQSSFDFFPWVSARIPLAMFSLLTCRTSLSGLIHKLQSAILTREVYLSAETGRGVLDFAAFPEGLQGGLQHFAEEYFWQPSPSA